MPRVALYTGTICLSWENLALVAVLLQGGVYKYIYICDCEVVCTSPHHDRKVEAIRPKIFYRDSSRPRDVFYTQVLFLRCTRITMQTSKKFVAAGGGGGEGFRAPLR